MGATTSKPPQITTNSLDADVPIIPPIVLLLLLTCCALLAKFVHRFRFLPPYLSSRLARYTMFALMLGISLQTVFFPALEAMHTAGSGVAFTPTAGVATTGVFAYTRNPFYCLLIFVQMPMLAILFDCAWIVVAIAPMFVWLSKVVIPGEEAFLTREFGSTYESYLGSTPRWLIP